MGLYKKAFEEYKKGLIAYFAIAIIFQASLGSIAVMLIQINGNSALQIFQFMLVTLLCMLYDVAVLSQLKPKISFNFLIISLVFSILIICLNLIN